MKNIPDIYPASSDSEQVAEDDGTWQEQRANEAEKALRLVQETNGDIELLSAYLDTVNPGNNITEHDRVTGKEKRVYQENTPEQRIGIKALHAVDLAHRRLDVREKKSNEEIITYATRRLGNIASHLRLTLEERKKLKE